MDIVHRVGIKAKVEGAYAALSTIEGLAGWWTTDTSGRSEPGGRIRFRFHDGEGGELGGADMEVRELARNEKVFWQVAEGPAEWVGTEIEFALSQAGEYAIVLFEHRGWREWSEFTSHCSTKWATFLLSLRDFVETGKGRPNPDDLLIGDWH
ncbi:MAG: SRPBCC domain-containing protein [Hyphomicrobiales bacterium]|nr:SRPBCC domain-containing protein [Hyphomicrobiales bacterium]MDE2017658.1 SRPBCC domain-containing protein [Hyphomicrobiales bacterium]